MSTEPIASLSNARVKDVVRLQRQGRCRRSAGLFCLESYRDLRAAREGGFAIREIFACGPVDQAVDLKSTQVTRPVLEKISYRQNPEGFVAVVQTPSRSLADVPLSACPLIVVCSGLEKPGNVGAIVRSADAAGADAVLLDDPEADVFNPNTVRASAGAVFHLPVVGASPSQLRAWLGERGCGIIGLSPGAGVRYTEVDLRQPCALVVGAEDRGLGDAWSSAVTEVIRIPLHGSVDSLNVSVAASVVLYEARRQRESSTRA